MFGTVQQAEQLNCLAESQIPQLPCNPKFKSHEHAAFHTLIRSKAAKYAICSFYTLYHAFHTLDTKL
eukprot:1151581-Pelagomonas_calceolata.AAC.1